MSFGIIGSSDWHSSDQLAYDKRKAHPAVVAVLQKFTEALPSLREEAERVLVACSMSFNNLSEAEDCAPSPITMLDGLDGGSWLPTLLTAIETAPLPSETQRHVMIGAYMIAESFIFHETLRTELANAPSTHRE